jgi:hypothetical protein
MRFAENTVLPYPLENTPQRPKRNMRFQHMHDVPYISAMYDVSYITSDSYKKTCSLVGVWKLHSFATILGRESKLSTEF